MGVLVWVPAPVDLVATLMGGVPDGVTLEHWDGSLPLPASAPEVQWLVPPPVYRGAGTLDALPALGSLRVIQVLNAGYDWLVGQVPPGVTVCNAGDANAAAVADWCAAAILADVRRFADFTDLQGQHRWEMRIGPSMQSLRVLIVGHGAIGSALGRRLAAFGSTVTPVVSRARDGMHGVDDLDALLPHADVVVLLCPLTPATTGLIDARRLALLPDGALVVNAARGPVLDTDALLAELRTRRLRAALDVTDPEPLPADHPLWDAPGVRITPHVGGGTRDFYAFTFPVVRAQLERELRGEPLANRAAI